MQSLYDRALRCLCWCLIKKQPAPYEPNDQKHTFIPLDHHQEEDTRLASEILSPLTPSIPKIYQEEPADPPPPLNFALARDNSHEDEQNLLKSQEISKDYSSVMSQSHPYYHLFKDKLATLGGIFDLPAESNLAEPYTEYGLKLHCYPEGKTNVFVYFFKMPTDLQTYEAACSDFSLQKKLDSNIDEYRKELEVIGQNTRVIYLSYKKILIISARDFYYVKHAFSRHNEHWSLTTSDLSYPHHENKVRGDMLLTATRIVEVAHGIEVAVYSQIDMKIPIKMELARNRGFAEIKKYLDKLYAHVGRKKEYDI